MRSSERQLWVLASKLKGKVLLFFDSLGTGIKRMVDRQKCLWQGKADDALLKFGFTQKIYQVDGLFWKC